MALICREQKHLLGDSTPYHLERDMKAVMLEERKTAACRMGHELGADRPQTQ